MSDVVTQETGTRGFVRCFPDTGCGGVWTWRPGSDERFTWPSEADARAWADTHLTVCDGPVEVVVTHRDGVEL